MSNNKLAKLIRQASQVHFASNSFGPIERFMLYALGFEYVGHLVYLHIGHELSHSQKYTMLRSEVMGCTAGWERLLARKRMGRRWMIGSQQEPMVSNRLFITAASFLAHGE